MLPTVFITGFGPFGTHKQNSSWLTVQELVKMDIEDFHVVAEEIPVEYGPVAEMVPMLWKKIQPQLTVHCGVSSEAQCLVLERCAHNENYVRQDAQGQLPVCTSCCVDGPSRIDTTIDLALVADDVNGAGLQIPVALSDCAGRYLCEFIYYTSLNINRHTVFVHIPPVTSDHTPEKMAKTLVAAIRSMLKQIADVKSS